MSKSLSVTQDKQELIRVLQSSLYPDAHPDSVELVLSYCQAAGLDPMQKPVHLVPMFSRAAGGMRDVIMPGIGLYRIQAARTGQFAGISEVEFGPEAEFMGVFHPIWARCTVRRLLPNGHIAEFTKTEFWRENYAEKGGKEKNPAPNAMWSKRPHGQIAKCVEAQALRTAFPEIGAQPTFEEMEGKEYASEFVDIPQDRAKVAAPSRLCEEAHFDTQLSKSWRPLIESGKKTAAQIIEQLSAKYDLTEAQKERLNESNQNRISYES